MRLRPIVFKKSARFLSIDFGAAFVKIAYLQSAGASFKLLNYDLKKILSADEHRREVVEFIGSFLKANNINEKQACLTIAPSDSLVIRILKLPAMPQKEVAQAAKLELKNEISFDLEEAIIDWQVAQEYSDEGARQNEIIFVAAQRRLIERYLSIIEECGLSCTRICSAPFNYEQLLSHYKVNTQICAVLDVGYQDSMLCIYEDNKLVFLRKLTYACDKITQALTTTLISDIGKLELSYEEAEKVKRHFGIPEEAEQILEGNIQAGQIISLIRPFLEELSGELKRSFDYFKKNFQKNSPSLIYLTGGGANLKNLDKYLYKQLDIEVQRLGLPASIDTQGVKKERLDEGINQIINAVAAAFADSRAINLLPEEIKTQKAELIEKVSLRLVAITLGAIFLFSLILIKLQTGDYQGRLKNARIHLQTISTIKALKENVDLRENLIDLIQEGKVPAEGLLKALSAVIPGEVVLEELTLEQARHSLILKGKVDADVGISDSILTNFMEKIEVSPFFAEASLLSSKNVEQAQEFEIKCELPQ